MPMLICFWNHMMTQIPKSPWDQHRRLLSLPRGHRHYPLIAARAMAVRGVQCMVELGPIFPF